MPEVRESLVSSVDRRNSFTKLTVGQFNNAPVPHQAPYILTEKEEIKNVSEHFLTLVFFRTAFTGNKRGHVLVETNIQFTKQI